MCVQRETANFCTCIHTRIHPAVMRGSVHVYDKIRIDCVYTLLCSTWSSSVFVIYFFIIPPYPVRVAYIPYIAINVYVFDILSNTSVDARSRENYKKKQQKN